MAGAIISGDLRDAILRHVGAIGQIEALLLPQDWDAKQVAARLDASETESLSRRWVDGLFVRNEGSYGYVCQSPDGPDMGDRLAAACSRHLISVTSMIHAKPRRIGAFAGAFGIRKGR